MSRKSKKKNTEMYLIQLMNITKPSKIVEWFILLRMKDLPFFVIFVTGHPYRAFFLSHLSHEILHESKVSGLSHSISCAPDVISD